MKHRFTQSNRRSRGREQGFSLIELLIVVALMIIMTVIAVTTLVRTRQLGVTDDQAVRIVEMLREARQLAISKRRPIRFEIDPTAREIRIIDTVTFAGGTADDILVKEVPLISAPVAVTIDSTLPAGISTLPETDYPLPDFNLVPHPAGGQSNNVWAVVFLNNGTIIDPASAAFGGTPLPVARTVLVQNLTEGAPTVRAVTIFGGTNSVRLWRHVGSSLGTCADGKDPLNGWCGM